MLLKCIIAKFKVVFIMFNDNNFYVTSVFFLFYPIYYLFTFIRSPIWAYVDYVINWCYLWVKILNSIWVG